MRLGRFFIIGIIILAALVVVYDRVNGGDDAMRPVLDPTLIDTPEPSPTPASTQAPPATPVQWDWVSDFDQAILVDRNDAQPDAMACGQRDNPCGSIQAALDNAFNGATIQVEAGVYAETITFSQEFSIKNLTINGNPHARPTVTGGIVFKNKGRLEGLTVARLVFKEAAARARGIVNFENAGVVANLTLDNNVFDGNFRPGLHGIRGGNLAGDLTVTHNLFRDILGWSVLDTHAASDVYRQFNTIVYSYNTVLDSNGTVALRGSPDAKTARAEVILNTWQGIGGNAGARGEQWAAIEVTQAQLAVVEKNVVNQKAEGLFGFGQPYQIQGVDNLKYAENEFNIIAP